MNSWNEMEEQFKPIKDFEGLYEVSNLGQVKNVKTNRILKPTINCQTGYKNVSLWKNNKGTNKTIHRLISMAFIPNLENKPQVNHINAIRTDNRIKNLEWVTSKENINHALIMGNLFIPSKQTLDLHTGIIFDSMKQACKSLNLNYDSQRVSMYKKNNKRLQYV